LNTTTKVTIVVVGERERERGSLETDPKRGILCNVEKSWTSVPTARSAELIVNPVCKSPLSCPSTVELIHKSGRRLEEDSSFRTKGECLEFSSGLESLYFIFFARKESRKHSVRNRFRAEPESRAREKKAICTSRDGREG
jgi:hypothetical protein